MFDAQLTTVARETPACQRLMAVPGIGVLTATALVAAVGDATAFRSGREMVAWLGLVPRQRSTGGRPTLLGISKRGDRNPPGLSDRVHDATAEPDESAQPAHPAGPGTRRGRSARPDTPSPPPRGEPQTRFRTASAPRRAGPPPPPRVPRRWSEQPASCRANEMLRKA